MAIIRRVFGPFKPEERRTGADPKLWWFFNGIRGDKTMAHWKLVYEINSRIFRVVNIPLGDFVGAKLRSVSKGKVKETAHPDAWLDDRPVMEGNVADILKQHLPHEEIAKATAASILKGKS